MQAVIILAFFSLLIGIMSSFVVGAGSSTSQLQNALTQETLTYFEGIEKVINQEFTPNRFEAAPLGTSIQEILSQTAILQIAPGKWANPTYDAWGNSLRLGMVRENIPLSGQAVAPVTGFLLLSAGPDRVFQTTVPTNLSSLAALQGIMVPAGSDDILATFTDEDAQRNTLSMLTMRLERIAGAMLRHYQIQMVEYRTKIENDYRNALVSNPATPPPDLTALLASDSNAPKFVNLSTDNPNRFEDRKPLGVPEEFDVLERLLPSGGQLEVSILSGADLRFGATLVLRNPAGRLGSPWPTVNLTIPLKGGFSS
jgi:hypothetical protein